jgi:dienelactone hydrolase
VLRAALTAIAAWFLLVAGSAAQVSLPPDVALGSLSDEVPADAAVFAGAWGGDAWDGILPHVMVVEQVHPDRSADVLYAWGSTPSGSIKPGWQRLSGTISNGRLMVEGPKHDLDEYELTADGKLLGHRKLAALPGWIVHIRLARFEGRDPAAVIAEAQIPPQPIWQEIRIPVHSAVGATAGQTLMLRAALYRSPREGRQPLLVLNHGCAGCAENAPRSPLVFRFEEHARFFMAAGFNVVVPMRKGYGASEGVLEPNFTSPKTQVDTAVEDIKAVFDDMQAQPYVDPKRIVIAGVSRGGMLSTVFAGRFPDLVAGVINFSGGWWADYIGGDTNVQLFREAGRAAKVPMLWLYADEDHLFPPVHVERYFRAFRDAGGDGQLVEVHDVFGDGHALFSWLDKWERPVSDYLAQIAARP